MRKFLTGAALTAGLLLVGCGTASAHNTTATIDVDCVGSQPVATVEFTNDYSTPVTIIVWDTEVVVPPATEAGPGKASATGDYVVGVHSYTAVWADGYSSEGSFDMGPLYEGCVNLVTIPTIVTTPPPTTTAPPPPDTTTTTTTTAPPDALIITRSDGQDDSTCTDGSDEGNERERTCLAMTGASRTVGLTEVGAALVAVGLGFLGLTRKRRSA